MGKSEGSEVGRRIAGRYELVSALAQGGMGDVFVAVDLRDGTRVAVKLLRAEHLADDAMRRRLRRERAVLRALDHPAIVRPVDFGIEDDGLVYLVIEHVEGPTLAQRLVEGPLDLESAGLLVATLGGALEAAHAHGVLHGDLKPANVLWRPPLPRLIDFGASKVLGLDRLTATGELVGTPAYMAPEALAGKGAVDERIDVYGLGVLLYEALSGQHPYRDSHVGRLLMKIDAGDRYPLDAVADVPATIAEVVHRAIDRDRDRRYRTMAELQTAWKRASESTGRPG